MPPRNETAAPAGAENSTLYVAIEISRTSWVVGIKSPVNERIGLHTIEGIVRLNGLDLQNLQLRTSRLQFDATRPAQRLGLV